MTRGHLNLRDAIGIALIAAFVGALGVLFWKAIPKDNEQIIVYVIGQLSGFVSAIVAFHYVTKAGEKELEQSRADNTGKAFEAVRAAALASPPSTDAETVEVHGENVTVQRDGHREHK